MEWEGGRVAIWRQKIGTDIGENKCLTQENNRHSNDVASLHLLNWICEKIQAAMCSKRISTIIHTQINDELGEVCVTNIFWHVSTFSRFSKQPSKTRGRSSSKIGRRNRKHIHLPMTLVICYHSNLPQSFNLSALFTRTESQLYPHAIRNCLRPTLGKY